MRTRPRSTGILVRFLLKAQCPSSCSELNPGEGTGPEAAARHTLRLLAGHILHLPEEISDLTKRITTAMGDCAPKLLDVYSVGPDTAATLLTAADDNPQRMGSEASFAALCGASPVEASSGKTRRRRRATRRPRRAGRRAPDCSRCRAVEVQPVSPPSTGGVCQGCALPRCA
ncbi:transposase [Streptomyces sp. NPDC053750]|uniref:transposase n=1 Tax=Streptomyces sp. NPDC053750 TaxID=3365714 RepID=UPI0037D135AB